MSKGLTGEDAEVLALLAQAPGLPKGEQKELMDSLSGDARKIAQALVGTAPDKRAAKAADAFRDWAGDLRPEGRKTESKT